MKPVQRVGEQESRRAVITYLYAGSRPGIVLDSALCVFSFFIEIRKPPSLAPKGYRMFEALRMCTQVYACLRLARTPNAYPMHVEAESMQEIGGGGEFDE